MEFLAAITTALLLLAALGFIVVKPWLSTRKRNYPPVAGTIFHQFINLRRLLDFMTDLSRRHKTFRMLTPFGNYMYTVDPANVEYILKTNFSNYGKVRYPIQNPNTRTSSMIPQHKDGIFAVDGEKWRHQRKVASYEFSAKVLRDYSGSVFKSNATKLAIIVTEASRNSQMIDMQELFMKSTLDSIFRVGFGVELDTLSGTNREGLAFARAFDDSSSQLMRRFFDVLWKMKRLLNVGLEAKMKRDVKLIDEFVYKLIDLKIKRESKQHDDMAKKEDILSRLLMEREKDTGTITIKYLRDIVLNFVIAGRDTTAGTLSWFIYMLCKNPDVQEKVAEEVKEAVGANHGKIDIKEFAAALTEEALNKMHYLHAALSETLRLYPAVPLDVKCCFSDDTLPDGFEVGKGDLINYEPFAMGRMKFLWGDDAEAFRPERWLTDDGVFVPENPFKFTAFQAGPRICLGKEFAYRQMKIVAATLLYFLKFKLWDEHKPVNYRTMLTLQIEGALNVRPLERA